MEYFINKKGEFWIENDEENKFCGKIIEKENSFFLKTDLDKTTPIPKKHLIIVGRIGNTPVTLYKCSLTNYSSKKIFLVRYILENYDNKTKMNFNHINIQFHNLENWINKDSLDVVIENDSTIINHTENKISYKYNEMNIDFLIEFDRSIKFNSFSIKKKYSIQIDSENGMHFTEILKIIRSLKNFLTFSMYNQTNLKNITCSLNESSKPMKINIYSKLFDYTQTELNRLKILLRFSDIESKKDIFERWFKINTKYKPLFDIYFMNFSDNLTIEYQLLSYTQALEGYMRKNEIFKDNFMNSKDYEIVKEELNKYVENSIMTSGQKDSWINKIEYGNEVSLRKRLKDLIRYLDNFDITQKITNGNFKEFIDNVVYIRNYYTHYSHDDTPDVNNLINTTFNLRLLIELCILNELNFDKKFIDYVLNRKYERKPILL